MPSPYAGVPELEWAGRTKQLVDEHPLSLDEIRSSCLRSWELLWQSHIGEGEKAVALADLVLPSAVVGFFFETLLARDLETAHCGRWRLGRRKDEKDLIYVPEPEKYSIEVKTSGQLGTKVFGNRSYGQKASNEDLVAKVEKSGYYLTVNFHGTTINLIRFGWIDFEDWRPQKAQSGQAASLSDSVYRSKLIVVPGDYQLKASVGIISRIGPKRLADLSDAGIRTVEDFLGYQGADPQLQRIRNDALRIYRP